MRLFVITLAALSAVAVAACNHEQKPADPAAPVAPATTEPAKQ